jgi:hypothetical protein
VRRAPQALTAVSVGKADRFTASTSFTNPAAALGRVFSACLDRIAPRGVPALMLAQLLGARIGPSSQRWPGPARSPFPRFGRCRYSVPVRRPRAAFDSCP